MKKTILDTQLIQTSPDNTGLLSKVPGGKHGANPLVTILNKTFNKQLKNLYSQQREYKKQKLTREYMETKQPGIIDAYRNAYPETWETELKELYSVPQDKKFIDFMNKGQNDTTRGLKISIDDLKEYQERDGYKGLVFSPQARPNILVLDFDIKLNEADLNKIITGFKPYLWLVEYKEENGHAHVYINSTEPDRLHYATRDENNRDLFYDREGERVKVDIFKGARAVVDGSNPTNKYNVFYDNKPGETIPVRDALQLLGETMNYTLEVEFMENKIEHDTHGTPTHKDNSTRYTRKHRPHGEQVELLEKAKEKSIQLFRDVEGEGIRHALYLNYTGALLHNGFEPENVREFMNTIYRETGDQDPRPAEYGSTITKYENGEQVKGIPSFKNLLDTLDRPEVSKIGADIIKIIGQKQTPELIQLRNGYTMDALHNTIYKETKNSQVTHLTASITGVTVYTEKHRNPEIVPQQTLYSLKYITETGEEGETRPDTIEGNTTQLKEQSFTVYDKYLKDIIKLVIEYYKLEGLEEHQQITPPEGFYLNMETGNIDYKGLTKEIRNTIETPLTVEKLREIITDYEGLTRYYKSLDKFISNTFSGCQLPLTYLVKQVQQEFNIQTPVIRAVSMTGTPGTGKSYNGEFILKFSGVIDKGKNVLNYTNVNTPYQYGEQCTHSTLPLAMEEADGLAHPKTPGDYSFSSLVKASITSINVRSRSMDGGKTNTNYPNYRNIVFSSNSTFKPDYGNIRRLISQVYTLTEIVTKEDRELKNEECPDNVETLILNRFFGAFIQTLRNKIEMYNRAGDKDTGITDIITNEDFVKNIIIDMYQGAELETPLYDRIYNYNTSIYEADITPTDANTIIKNQLFNYIVSIVSERLNMETPKGRETDQTTLNEYNTQSLYNLPELTKIVYEEITFGHIPGIKPAVKKQPDTVNDLEVALTRELVDVLNNNKEIQITLPDLEFPTGGEYAQIRNIGTKGVRVKLGVLIDNIFN